MMSWKRTLSVVACTFAFTSVTFGVIPCQDIDRFQGRCTQQGKLQMRLILTDFSHHGENVTIAIDGQEQMRTIVGNRVGISVSNQLGTGPRTITLVDPAGCVNPIMVDCGGGKEERLAGTMNFENITGTNVVQVIGETSSNEKEVEVGDFDNDDDLDVVIGNALSDFGQRKNKLYRNDGGVFMEISGAPAISGFSGTDVTRNAFFRDYDGDGWLDIIVVNDNNTGGDGGRTKVYMNNHPGDVFSTYTEEGVVRLGAGTGGAACGAVSVNHDNANRDDLYVGNYPGPSQDTMYFNDGTGFFTNMTNTNVPVDGDYTVDVASADMNNDGKIDLLISNWSPGNYIYYNDLNGAGGSTGDYRYTGSQQLIGDAGSNENAMEPGDFDNDGDQDIYWSNFSGSTGDRILQNNGNDGGNKATFATLNILPTSVTGTTSRKATVADLNNDGRLDVIVAKQSGSSSRPTVLRNTSVDGTISFVDWTPAMAFPNGSSHEGWHAAAFNTDEDDFQDIFLGGYNDDHLFKNVESNEVNEGDLPGGGIKTLPAVNNVDPVAVVGNVSVGTPDMYETTGVAGGSFVSVVLNGCDDYLLEVLDGANTVLGSSDRGGIGVEEALQINASGTVRVRVTNLVACGGGNAGNYVLEILSRN